MFPELYAKFVSQFSGLPREGTIGHDHCDITVIEVCTCICFLNCFIADRIRIIFTLDSIFYSIFLCEDINTLITAAFSDSNFMETSISQ